MSGQTLYTILCLLALAVAAIEGGILLSFFRRIRKIQEDLPGSSKFREKLYGKEGRKTTAAALGIRRRAQEASGGADH